MHVDAEEGWVKHLFPVTNFVRPGLLGSHRHAVVSAGGKDRLVGARGHHLVRADGQVLAVEHLDGALCGSAGLVATQTSLTSRGSRASLDVSCDTEK